MLFAIGISINRYFVFRDKCITVARKIENIGVSKYRSESQNQPIDISGLDPDKVLWVPDREVCDSWWYDAAYGLAYTCFVLLLSATLSWLFGGGFVVHIRFHN